jgi:putative spermidine/putrescine transport system substrate-binding protein
VFEYRQHIATCKAKRGTNRRSVLAAGAALIAAPAVFTRPARAAGQVVVRTAGGSYSDAITPTIYDPFTRETGIEVVKVPATIGRIFAMFRSGNIELDVIDTELAVQINLFRQGALAPINYDAWKITNASEIDPPVRLPWFVGSLYLETVMGYNKDTFPNDSHPKNWAEFWDVKRFPGPRTFPDISGGQPPLEFALLADGVSADKLYPLDLDRAFKSLDRIRPSIVKFWDSGQLSQDLISRKEVVLGGFWSNRLLSAINGGAPAAIEWNQGMLQAQGFSIFKGAKNIDNAQKLIEFAVNARNQANFLDILQNGPTNSQALKLMKPESFANVPSNPEHQRISFRLDVDWWQDNREAINTRWSRWLVNRT